MRNRAYKKKIKQGYSDVNENLKQNYSIYYAVPSLS